MSSILGSDDSPILLSPPHLTGGEMDRLAEAVDSGWIALLGPQVDAFERELASVTERSYAVALASGTAAIHVGLKVLGVEPGDTVLCSTLTFVASAAPIRYCGAEPVFVDAAPETWNMDPELFRAAVEELANAGRRPKAAVIVDVLGQAADYEPLLEVCQEYDIRVLEDAAEALGGTYRGRPVGAFGDVAVLSFNGNKIVTTSGGGALLMDDPALADRAFFLANQAQDPAPHYQHSVIGFNYRLSNLLASVGREQLSQLQHRVDLKRAIHARYEEALSDIDGFACMPEAPYGRSTRWLTAATLDRGNGQDDRDRVLEGLRKDRIEARPVWKPMHLQPVFDGAIAFGGEVSERLFRTGICLPSGTSMSPPQQDRVIESFRRHAG